MILYVVILVAGIAGFIICITIMMFRTLNDKNPFKVLPSVLLVFFLIMVIWSIGTAIGIIPKIETKSSNTQKNENKVQATTIMSRFYYLSNKKETYSLEQVAMNKDAVILIKNGSSSGSGFIINEKGYVLTNYHVIKNSLNPIAVFMDNDGEEGKELPLTILTYDSNKDIALLKLNSNNKYNYLSFANSNNVVDAQKIMTIGSPKGIINSISEGIVSGKRNISHIKYIQITAALSPGNSGGALLNMSGELIGMNTFKIIDAENLNFAISSNDIIDFLESNLVKNILEGMDNINNSIDTQIETSTTIDSTSSNITNKLTISQASLLVRKFSKLLVLYNSAVLTKDSCTTIDSNDLYGHECYLYGDEGGNSVHFVVDSITGKIYECISYYFDKDGEKKMELEIAVKTYD